MKPNRTTALEEYVRRILPQTGSLYCAAHAMTGNREQAEVLLGTALCNSFAESDAISTRASLRAGVLREMKRCALAAVQQGAQRPENDFCGLCAPGEEDTPLYRAIAASPASIQRVLILKYGAQLPTHVIAQLLDVDQEEVRASLGRARRQLMRGEETKKETLVSFEQRLTAEVRRGMSRTGAQQADVSRILRTFEEDARGRHAAGHWLGKAVRGVLLTALTALLAAAIWLVAVLAEM